jgi:hypothetical protein
MHTLKSVCVPMAVGSSPSLYIKIARAYLCHWHSLLTCKLNRRYDGFMTLRRYVEGGWGHSGIHKFTVKPVRYRLL